MNSAGEFSTETLSHDSFRGARGRASRENTYIATLFADQPAGIEPGPPSASFPVILNRSEGSLVLPQRASILETSWVLVGIELFPTRYPSPRLRMTEGEGRCSTDFEWPDNESRSVSFAAVVQEEERQQAVGTEGRAQGVVH